jgi:hypothetical protein
MRKVDDACHAKDERQTRGHQKQRRSRSQPVEGLNNEAGGVHKVMWAEIKTPAKAGVVGEVFSCSV